MPVVARCNQVEAALAEATLARAQIDCSRKTMGEEESLLVEVTVKAEDEERALDLLDGCAGLISGSPILDSDQRSRARCWGSKEDNDFRPIEPLTVWILQTLMVFVAVNGILGWLAFFMALFLRFELGGLFLAVAVFSPLVFWGMRRWGADGWERPKMKGLLPAVMTLWAVALAFALSVVIKVIISGLVPYGRRGALLDGCTELALSIIPVIWFLVPFALTLWLCWRVLPRGRASHSRENR